MKRGVDHPPLKHPGDVSSLDEVLDFFAQRAAPHPNVRATSALRKSVARLIDRGGAKAVMDAVIEEVGLKQIRDLIAGHRLPAGRPRETPSSLWGLAIEELSRQTGVKPYPLCLSLAQGDEKLRDTLWKRRNKGLGQLRKISGRKPSHLEDLLHGQTADEFKPAEHRNREANMRLFLREFANELIEPMLCDLGINREGILERILMGKNPV